MNLKNLLDYGNSIYNLEEKFNSLERKNKNVLVLKVNVILVKVVAITLRISVAFTLRIV